MSGQITFCDIAQPDKTEMSGWEQEPNYVSEKKQQQADKNKMSGHVRSDTKHRRNGHERGGYIFYIYTPRMSGECSAFWNAVGKNSYNEFGRTGTDFDLRGIAIGGCYGKA